MPPLPVRGFWIDQPLRDALREYAWIKRTTAGDVIRAALEDVVNNPADVSMLSKVDNPARIHMSVKVGDELWNGARKAAAQAGKPFSPLVRRRIRKILELEGLI